MNSHSQVPHKLIPPPLEDHQWLPDRQYADGFFKPNPDCVRPDGTFPSILAPVKVLEQTVLEHMAEHKLAMCAVMEKVQDDMEKHLDDNLRPILEKLQSIHEA